jgi:hypothetical protein
MTASATNNMKYPKMDSPIISSDAQRLAAAANRIFTITSAGVPPTISFTVVLIVCFGVMGCTG